MLTLHRHTKIKLRFIYISPQQHHHHRQSQHTA